MHKGKKKNATPEDDFGTREILCQHCGLTFEVEWKEIFEIQELTHGYVGYEFGDYSVICPGCGKVVVDDEDGDTYSKLEIQDEKLPF